MPCDCLTLPVLPLSSLRLCMIQTLSSAKVSPVSPCSQRLRADRISIAACSLMPGRPPRRATSTSTRRRRTERYATLSATVWKQTNGKSWEQGRERGQPQYQTYRDPALPATLRRYVLGLNWVLKLGNLWASYNLGVGMGCEQCNQKVSFCSQIVCRSVEVL